MTVDAINRPDAEDMSVAFVKPVRELQSCNHLLDDHAALEAFYEDQGYILLRGVFDPQSVAEARDAMLAVAAALGLTTPGDPTGTWTGAAFAGGMEESDSYSGIARKLIEHPANLAVMEKVLGEPAVAVPIVQYRTYPPHGPITVVHQDGFYSPGIQDYKPVWVPLSPCDRSMGGLAVAVAQNKRGYFHNIGKPAPYPFPRDAVPDDAWATTDYLPGDVLIVHPYTPHCSLANTSSRLRITFDSRVQSARNPSAIAATVLAVSPTSITVDAGGPAPQTFSVDKDTFLRPVNPGVREPFESFAEVTRPGMRLVVVRDGNRAVMLRKAAEG
ncbi:MAG TPA: phytanoyl-CoA dioxygenase family protein [Novosphingobium sp.]|nr:phytanoyl-CoA dioxygenase family protein [Novosphingobium sp.]HZV09105.1 phytanoyl-CoA dioxygenase family protein [Novosphingobium sp.]